MSKPFTVCDKYEQRCDTCKSSWITKTCYNPVCDTRPVCKSGYQTYESKTCPDDGYYCNGNYLEQRDYACDSSCSYSIKSGSSCAYGCSNGACNSNPYPFNVSRGAYSFTAFDANQESLLKDFLGLVPAGSKDLDSYLASLSKQGVLEWEDYWVTRWVTINKPNTPWLASFTINKGESYLRVCGDGACNYGETGSSCPSDCCSSHVSTTCSDGSVYWVNSCGMREGLKDSCNDSDACTLDSCSNGACIHSVITPCHGNSVCESGENICNAPTDCSYSCGSCQSVSCSGGVPNCQYNNNCCGNHACEYGESCSSCPVDCQCALGIDLSSVSCSARGASCASTDVSDNDVILASFRLLNSSGHSVSVSFRTGSGLNLGTITTSSSLVSHSFFLPAGWQNVLVSVVDDYGGSVDALIFSLNVLTNSSSNGLFVNYPFDYEAGNNQPSSEAPAGYESGSGLFATGLMLSILAGAGAYAFIKFRQNDQGTCVPGLPSLLEQEQREGVWDNFFSAFTVTSDFIKGFILGSDENSSYSQCAGDFIGGMLLVGDIRDAVLYGLSKTGVVDREYDEVFLSLALFGIGTEFFDVGDAAVTALKGVWKKLPSAVKKGWTIFFKQASKSLDDLGSVFKKLVDKLPLNKISSFFESVGHLIGRTPLNKLDDLLDLFNKLLKYGDDVPGRLLRRLAGLDEAVKLSKYVDDVGEASFRRLVRVLGDDELVDLATSHRTVAIIDEATNIEAGYHWVTRYGDEVDDAWLAVSSKVSGFSDEFTVIKGPNDYFGMYDPSKDMVYLNINKITDNAYEISLHEFTHKASITSGVIVRGFDTPIDGYFELLDNIKGLNYEYDSLYNQFYDTVVNKLILTNDNANVNKWYSQWLSTYQEKLDLFTNPNAVNIIKDLKGYIIPELAEMKLVFEQVDVEKAVKIDELIELVRQANSGIADDFNTIYNGYKEIFDKVNWQ